MIQMGSRIFLSEMNGKPVETAGGRSLGVLDGLVIDTATGDLLYLLVDSNGAVYTKNHKVDEKGRYVIQADTVSIEASRIVIN